MSNNLIRYAKFIVKNNKKMILLSFFLVLIITIVESYLPQIMKNIIDKGIINKNIIVLKNQLIFFSFFSIISVALEFILGYIYSKMRHRVSVKLRLLLLGHIGNLSGEFYSNKKTGNLLSIIQSDVEIVENLNAELFFLLMKNLLLSCISIYFMIKIDVQLFAIVFFFQLSILLIQVFFSKKIHKMVSELRKEYGEINNILQEYLFNIEKIVISNSKLKFIHKYITMSRKYINKSISSNIIIDGNVSIASLINIIISITIYGIGAYKIIDNEFTLGYLLAFQNYSKMLTGPCISAININNFINQAEPSISRIFSIFDQKSNINANYEGKSIKNTTIYNISFEDVVFSYNVKNEPLLKGVNMSFSKGGVYGIIGDSGCGKSTIIKLLYRFWDVDSGKILVNGIDISKINLFSLRKKISVVTQDVLIYDGSILDNISKSRKKHDLKKIEQLCEDVGLRKYIENLEDGIFTNIGENGVRLSGGLKQRIAIARAIMNDQDILILDEASSGLDINSENVLFKNIEKYFQNKIVIIITHRLSILKKSERIFVIKNGKIKKIGTYQEIILSDGKSKKE
ncbi:ABC transporter ATP-binding protein [Peptostreptococcus porci]|uniref:ABC transporter ATP-binding protein n=1 Tax=Peptostreptococcus porci TaxID=2652282 RepID=UPI002A809A8A|nr:ABC transporter ATP-binding protein [Peptostreptococcus porci]MDY4129015.1 ABC transporter ATP-binding protein [Peptostreptococcus porci]